MPGLPREYKFSRPAEPGNKDVGGARCRDYDVRDCGRTIFCGRLCALTRAKPIAAADPLRFLSKDWRRSITFRGCGGTYTVFRGPVFHRGDGQRFLISAAGLIPVVVSRLEMDCSSHYKLWLA